MAVIYEVNFPSLDGQKLMKDIYDLVIQKLSSSSIPSSLPNNFRESIKQILQNHYVTNLTPITLNAVKGFIRQVNPLQRKASEEGKKFLQELMKARSVTGFSADGNIR